MVDPTRGSNRGNERYVTWEWSREAVNMSDFDAVTHPAKVILNKDVGLLPSLVRILVVAHCMVSVFA